MAEAKTQMFTLVAYRPNDVDMARGCVLASSDSSHSITFYTDSDAVVAAWARQIFADYLNPSEFARTEFTLLVDGRESDAWALEQGDECPVITLHEELQRRAEALGEKWFNERMDEEQRKKSLEAERAEHSRVASERVEYERLHAIYGAKPAIRV